MANAYTIISVQNNNPQPGSVTITGTVNGTPVSFTTLFTTYQANSASAVAFENWVAPLLLAAFNAMPTSVAPPTLSFSQ